MFVAETLAKNAAGLDKDGIDLMFTVDGHTHDKGELKGDPGRKALNKALHAAWPENTTNDDSLTDMRRTLAEVVKKWNRNKRRATTLLVLTDGVWSKTDQSALDATILDIARQEQHHAGNRHFSIQFIRFGDHENEKTKLQWLDDNLCSQHSLRCVQQHVKSHYTQTDSPQEHY